MCTGGFPSPYISPSTWVVSTDGWRNILVLYRQVRRRRAVGLCRGVFRRRTCDTGIWTKPLALAADAGFAMGFQSIFASEGLPEAGFAKRAVIDADRCFHERFA